MNTMNQHNEYLSISVASAPCTNQETVDQVNIFAMVADFLSVEPLSARDGYEFRDRAWESHDYLNS